MASSSQRVTKKQLIEMLKDFKDNDFIGVVFSVQSTREDPCHQVLMFYEATEDIL